MAAVDAHPSHTLLNKTPQTPEILLIPSSSSLFTYEEWQAVDMSSAH